MAATDLKGGQYHEPAYKGRRRAPAPRPDASALYQRVEVPPPPPNPPVEKRK